MSHTHQRIALLLCLGALTFSGCSQLGGGLRRDFDDGQVSSGPTSGGRWAERGLLDDDDAADEAPAAPGRYATVGHSERSPASAENTGDTDQQSWNSGDTAARFTQNTQSTRMQGPRRPQFKNGYRARRADFIDESTNEGSLWAPEGQTNYYFSKNKIRSVGDIVTVTLEDQLVKDVAVEVKRTLTRQEAVAELGIAQQRMIAKRQGGSDSKAMAAANAAVNPGAPAPAREPASSAQDKNDGDLPEPTMNDVDLAGALEIKANDTIMAEIVERYPNGNYKIRGTKKVLYKNGSPRLLTMVAIAKGSDISEDDVVNSGKLYEYRLEAVR